MQLRQIPTPAPPPSSTEPPESSESESELEYTDSDTTDPDMSEDEFLCDIAASASKSDEPIDELKSQGENENNMLFDAIVAAAGSVFEDGKSDEEEGENIRSLNNLYPVEAYYPLDQCDIFESSSSSDSCPSPLTPPLQEAAKVSSMSGMIPTEIPEVIAYYYQNPIDVTGLDILSVSGTPIRGSSTAEAQSLSPEVPSTTTSPHRDRSPVVLKKSMS